MGPQTARFLLDDPFDNDAGVELVAMRLRLEAAAGIAIVLDHAEYDCTYIALAEAEGLHFVAARLS